MLPVWVRGLGDRDSSPSARGKCDRKRLLRPTMPLARRQQASGRRFLSHPWAAAEAGQLGRLYEADQDLALGRRLPGG
jgi:hypothetical protein